MKGLTEMGIFSMLVLGVVCTCIGLVPATNNIFLAGGGFVLVFLSGVYAREAHKHFDEGR